MNERKKTRELVKTGRLKVKDLSVDAFMEYMFDEVGEPLFALNDSFSDSYHTGEGIIAIFKDKKGAEKVRDK
jgi:hypothetical protein